MDVCPRAAWYDSQPYAAARFGLEGAADKAFSIYGDRFSGADARPAFQGFAQFPMYQALLGFPLQWPGLLIREIDPQSALLGQVELSARAEYLSRSPTRAADPACAAFKGLALDASASLYSASAWTSCPPAPSGATARACGPT